jgi:L-aminopeptidase/D-esterase-like protein
MLSGGSAFGLESIWGAMQYLEERGVGFAVGKTVVPHVAGAIIFDLNVGDHRARPDRRMGYAACESARAGDVAEGNVGAGTGATVGKLHRVERAMRGGLGCATIERGTIAVSALMVVNAVGDVRDPATGLLIAGTRDAPDGRRLIDTAAALARGATLGGFAPVNTTIGCVVTDAALSRGEATRVAQLAMQGFVRSLSPPHLASDGDALFCLSVGEARAGVETVGAAAADAVAAAIARAVRAATALPGLPAARDL